MLQVKSIRRLDQVELGLQQAAARHGATVLATSHLGQLLWEGESERERDAITFTLCFADQYRTLMAADMRLAAFLPVRVAASRQGESVTLEAMSPREFCRLLHRADLEPAIAPLEEALRAILVEAAQPVARAAMAGAGEHRATEDQVNMRAALPQRIDCRGSKVEDLAGTGSHDAQGG